MIFAQFDESYIFDCLTVFDIKLNKQRNMHNLANYERYRNIIIDQIGQVKFDKVIGSEEYKNLQYTNLVLFNFFDHVKTEEGKNISAVEVDKHNYARYLAKKELQEKFFVDSPMKEIKLGY